MPGAGVMIVIVVAMLLTGAVAFYISRNVEHGEARFGPDGPLPPYDPPVEEKNRTVTISRSEISQTEEYDA